MKKWDRFKIDKILKNKTYIGYLIQSKKKTISHKIHKVIENKPDNWVIIKNHHESIITNEEFEQVQDIIYNRDIKINKNKKYDVFSGHIKCADCGNALTIFQSKKYEYYYCASYMRKKSCLSNHSIKKEILNEIVLKMINKQIELVKEIDNKIENIVVDEEVNYDIEILNNRIVDIDNHIVKYKKLKNDIRNDYIGNFINKEDYTEYEKEYDSYLKQYVDEKNIVLDKLNNIDKKSSKNKFWMYKYINNSKIEKLSKKIVDELIEDIIVHKNGNIKIIFKYNDEYNEALV